MGQQLSHGDVGLSRGGELRPVLPHRGIEFELPPARQTLPPTPRSLLDMMGRHHVGFAETRGGVGFTAEPLAEFGVRGNMLV